MKPLVLSLLASLLSLPLLSERYEELRPYHDPFEL